ncbi:MAG: tripartite tricarboxylate transporter permease [Nanoarchaeota archaeon]|nr:tripartite tricarboxylate transporter permease [Nanoarchaeota archaeon]
MIPELLIALVLGLIVGTITGLTPGIHINLIAVILISNIVIFQGFPLIIPAVFIASMAIAHTFLDFIPSVFLGAPEEDTFLSVLPGHQMLKQGLAHEAVVLTLYGSLSALLIILLFTPVFIYLIPIIFETAKLILPFILIFISLYMIFREEKILTSLTIFLLAGFLGFAALNLPIKQPLLPLLTGIFGSSALILSMKAKTKITKQKIPPLKKINPSKKEFFKATLGSIISAPLCSFLPGIGAGHAAVIGSEFIGQSKKGFLIMLGGINTIVIGLSFITLFSIGRTRTGAAVAIKEILKEITLTDLTIIIGAIVISGILAFIIAINISKFTAKHITKINYRALSLIVLFILLVITIIFSNLLGLLVFIIATSLGIFTILSGARRINLMGVLLIPTILFYLI